MAGILEVAVDSLALARAAISGGADRLELCSAFTVGGLTPYAELIKQVQAESDIKIRRSTGRILSFFIEYVRKTDIGTKLPYNRLEIWESYLLSIMGGSLMRNYFCGWYFRCQSDCQTLAIIPSIHRTEHSNFCTIQFITDTDALNAQFPYSDFQKQGDQIKIADNRFGRDGMILDIQSPDLFVRGSVQFGAIFPIRYDIMGPFRYIPFMQCKHSVYSLRHTVDGEIVINGTPYIFRNAVGYIEGDRGHSFPKRYAWTQCHFPDGVLMLSVADIPFCGLCFTGIIGVVLLKGKEYRLATYLGAKSVKAAKDEILIQQGSYSLTVRPQDPTGHPLRAPVAGAMTRTIYEHPSCNVYYRFEKDGSVLLELNAQNAAFECEL